MRTVLMYDTCHYDKWCGTRIVRCNMVQYDKYVIKENLEPWYGIKEIMYVKCASMLCPVNGFQNNSTGRQLDPNRADPCY